MYNDYFGLKGAPFSIAPNPAFLYMSDRHREALAHLLYGIRADGGFVLLTGEVGTGKTTVCRCLLEQIPEDVDTAFVLNPKLTAIELLATICDDLGIEYPAGASIKVLVDHLNDFLLASYQQGRRTVLIIDEAQNLSIDVLEQLRLLTNLETNQRKLLQIILLGQPELLDILDRNELRQLSQRVTARFHLDSLTREEVQSYIEHRLEVAGGRGTLFPTAAVRRIYQLSGGIPRLINLICDRALLGTYAGNRLQVDVATVDTAATEILGKTSKGHGQLSLSPPVTMALGLVLVAALATGLLFNAGDETPATAAPPITSTPKPAVSPATPTATPTREPVITATATPISAPTSQTDLLRLDSLVNVQGEASYAAAMGQLFTLWNAPVSDVGAEPCEQAELYGLRCMSSLGSLRDIRHLDRPALIRLSIAGIDHYLAITGIEGSRVSLASGAGTFTLGERDLLSSWDGNYTILWRLPPEYRVVQQGDSGPTVDWLSHQLSVVDGTTAPALQDSFDKSLENRLKRFQMSVGLRPDGIAGERTWIHLNGAANPDDPTLSSAAGDS